jgi:tripartite-type tricarboxylate transporter receptor subunit TctC
MKKILAILLVSAFAVSAQAKETVTIVYSWSAADPAANFDRAIIHEANQLQNKYQFLFEAKPGAGGTVAANYALTNANSVLATSSAFFIRPNFYPTDSHDIAKFQALMPKCVVTALITSSKYKTWKEVPTNKPLSIGVSGLGTTTHLIAEQIVAKYPNMQVIPFKSTSEALVNVIGGQVDFAVNFIGDVESWTKENSTKRTLNVLGATGSQPMGKIPTLVSQGFSAELSTMSPPHQYLIPASLSDEKTREIREILVKASKTPAVKAAYAIDQCRPFEIPESQLQSWYQTQTSKWKTLTTGVKVK